MMRPLPVMFIGIYQGPQHSVLIRLFLHPHPHHQHRRPIDAGGAAGQIANGGVLACRSAPVVVEAAAAGGCGAGHDWGVPGNEGPAARERYGAPVRVT